MFLSSSLRHLFPKYINMLYSYLLIGTGCFPVPGKFVTSAITTIHVGLLPYVCVFLICALLIEMCNLMYSNVNVFQLTSFDLTWLWLELKAQQALLLNSTISTTSWNYTFSEQDGFDVVTWCVGWCLERNKSPKVCFYKRKLILPKLPSIEFWSFFICCCPRVALNSDTSG